MFIGINAYEENFNIFKAINEIYRHIKKSTEKSLIDKISKRLLELVKSFNNNKGIKKNSQKSIDISIKHGFRHKETRLIVLFVRILHTILKKTKKKWERK